MSVLDESTLTDQTEIRSQSAAPWLAVRVVLGLVLLVAAMLKAYKLWVRPVDGATMVDARAFGIVVIEIELAIGLLLLIGGRVLSRPAWFAGIVFFVIALQVAILQGVRGEPHCGCFGVVEVSPWTAVFIDLAAISALLASFPPASEAGSRKTRAAVVGGMTIVLGGFGAFLLATRRQLRARPPVGQQLQEVGDAHAAAVEVAGAGTAPLGEQQKKISNPNEAVGGLGAVPRAG